MATQSSDLATVFMDTYECAKKADNWNQVLSSLWVHPEWLTKIPTGHHWSILHQIVYSGNVSHLNEVLALQTTNKQFRLLCKTTDNKTVQEISTERKHIYPHMMRCITRLVTLDQLLDMAKGCQWNSLRELIRQQPDIVNEKPPYRRYYLAHHLAYMGQLDLFKELSNICQFQLDLRADRKTINQVAREHNHIDFAEYIERMDPNLIRINSTSRKHEQEDIHDNTIIGDMSKENFLKSITCCITQEILCDPVMAADGFTYEREAILTWFQQSNRSPMTNQELDNLEIKPNYAIKSIIQLSKDTNNLSK